MHANIIVQCTHSKRHGTREPVESTSIYLGLKCLLGATLKLSLGLDNSTFFTLKAEILHRKHNRLVCKISIGLSRKEKSEVKISGIFFNIYIGTSVKLCTISAISYLVPINGFQKILSTGDEILSSVFAAIFYFSCHIYDQYWCFFLCACPTEVIHLMHQSTCIRQLVA